MRTDLRKIYQEFVEQVESPMFVYIYETGKIVAINKYALDKMYRVPVNIRQILDKNVYSVIKGNGHESAVVRKCNLNNMSHDEKIKGQTMDIEFNCIKTKNRHIVLCIMVYSYKNYYSLKYKKMIPKIFWNMVTENNKVSHSIFGSETFMKEVHTRIGDDPDCDFMDKFLYEDVKRMYEINMRITNTKKSSYDNIAMVNYPNGNVVYKYNKMPILNEDNEVEGIITLLYLVVSTDEYKSMLEDSRKETYDLDRIMSEGNYIYTSTSLDDSIVRFVSSNISILGYQASDFYEGKVRFRDRIYEEDLNLVLQYDSMLQNPRYLNDKLSFEYRVLTKDDDVVWIHKEIMVVKDNDNLYKNSILHVVEERKNSLGGKTVLETSKRLFKSFTVGEAIVDSVDTLICVIDVDTHEIVRPNKEMKEAFEEDYGKEIIGEKIHDIIEKCDISVHGMYWYKKQGGRYYRCKYNKDTLNFGANIVVITLTDITQILSEDMKKEILAGKDLLTGLGNKMDYEIRFSQYYSNTVLHEKNSAVVVMDIDNFNDFNIKNSFNTGDKILKKIAHTFSNGYIEKTECFKLGQDSFIFLVEGCEDIEEKISSIYNISQLIKDEMTYSITVSLGVALFPLNGTSPREVLDNALKALDKAKRTGKNRIVYHTNKNIKKNVSVSHNLNYRESDSINLDDFVVRYTPVIETNTNIVVGANASVWWYSSSTGFVNPRKRFLEKIMTTKEYIENIIPIGDKLIAQALSMCKEINDKYDENFTLHIKLSAMQILAGNGMNRFNDYIKRINVNSSNIVVDLTECLSVENVVLTKLVVEEVKKIGCKIELEDDETGNLTIEKILEQPIDIVRIKDGFSEKIKNKEIDDELLRRVINTAHGMNIKVSIGELEKESQVEQIKKYGIDLFRGFCHKKPIEGREFLKLLAYGLFS